MDFIGRKQELQKMNQIAARDQQEVLLIYGRRRVGKSELIKHFLRQQSGTSIYYACKQTSEQNNVVSLSTLLAEEDGYPPLGFTNMEQLLEFLFQKACDAPFILVLDEYPYLRQVVTGMDSILQSLIDKYADRSKMKLILCGSFVEVMQSLLLAHNPLYGRISASIRLHPMDYYEAAAFYPSFSPEDKVRLYSVFGGIPYYNRWIDPSLSVKENILQLLVEPGARLESEVPFYLQGELSRMTNANDVFDALARGFHRFNDLLAQSHLNSSASLTNVLKRLMIMEVVRKEAPINDENNRKKTGYFIQDPMSAFFYRYLFRHASQRQVMDPKVFYDRYIEEDFENTYVPKCFEEICRQFLVRQNRQGILEEPFELIGKYYYDLPQEHRNGEFDVVTKDPRGYIFYEAKFRNTPITAKMMQTEIEQVNATGLYCYRYGFFSRSGFEPPKQAREDIRMYDLKELFE